MLGEGIIHRLNLTVSSLPADLGQQVYQQAASIFFAAVPSDRRMREVTARPIRGGDWIDDGYSELLLRDRFALSYEFGQTSWPPRITSSKRASRPTTFRKNGVSRCGANTTVRPSSGSISSLERTIHFMPAYLDSDSRIAGDAGDDVRCERNPDQGLHFGRQQRSCAHYQPGWCRSWGFSEACDRRTDIHAKSAVSNKATSLRLHSIRL